MWFSRFRPATQTWLRAFRALAWAVSPLSCGRVQQGVSLGGSAGAMNRGETYRCGLLGSALPLYVTLGENMKPYEGKHETPKVLLVGLVSLRWAFVFNGRCLPSPNTGSPVGVDYAC